MSDEQLAAKYGEAALGWIKQLQGRNINNDALVTLNYRTGAVLAYVGSRQLLRRGDARPPAELRRGGPGLPAVGLRLQADHLRHRLRARRDHARHDAHGRRSEIDRRRASAVPNADRRERGPVRVRDALKYSMNIPVAKAQQLIGTQDVVDMAERLGLHWDPAAGRAVAVPSLTLGTIGVHQLDLAGAYGAIANGGVLTPPYLIERSTTATAT